MKLTIDTKEDSHHEIRKAIRLLMSLIGDTVVPTNDPALVQDIKPSTEFNLPSDDGGIFGAMFSGDSTVTDTEDKKESSEEVEFF